ncbi:MAG: sulfurtransferase TusA family protein [Rhodocyclaceae bacterium]|nr:sulfurtransferase TusA family protein [Rhodocyclaceae bacterium]
MNYFDKEVDARGLNCPLPILRAKKMLATMEGGQVVRVIATDPGSVKDFAAFAKQTGNELIHQGQVEGEAEAFEFFLRRKA